MKQFLGIAASVLSTMALISGGAARAAGEVEACVSDPNAEAVANPYEGYSPTGYKGALERDRVWFATVRKIRHRNGAVRYVFKRAPRKHRVEYESIDTMPLGGRAVGFVATRQACDVLLDRRGRELGVPAFDSLESEEGPGDADSSVALITRKVAASGAYSYALFVKGRLKATSPHQYLANYSAAPIASANTEWRALKPVAVTRNGGMGVLDMRTLREVLVPQWLGVGQITDFSSGGKEKEKAPPSYLLAQDARGLHLFTLEGRPIELPHFDRIDFIHNWMREGREAMPPGSGNPVVIQTQEIGKGSNNATIAGPCRIYSDAFEPLLDVALPAQACLSRDSPGGRYFAMSMDGLTQVYRKNYVPNPSGGSLTLEHVGRDIPGELVYPLKDGKAMLRAPKRMGPDAAASASTNADTNVDTHANAPVAMLPPYRIVTPEGQDVPERSFDAFRNLGCGFVTVGREGKTWMLGEDGSLSAQLRYPFSC